MTDVNLEETLKDNLNIQTEGNLQEVVTAASTVDTLETPIQPEEIPEKYRGKSVQEIIEMHENATRKISELGSKVHELEAKPAEIRPEITPLFAPRSYESNEEIDPRDAQVQALANQNRQLAITMSLMLARSDNRMPAWGKYESEVIELLKTKPYIMNDPDWTKTAYDLVDARKLPEKILEAEERGKNQVMKKEVKKLEATVLDSSRNAPAPVTKEVTPSDKRDLWKQGKMTTAAYLQETLSDAELGK